MHHAVCQIPIAYRKYLSAVPFGKMEVLIRVLQNIGDFVFLCISVGCNCKGMPVFVNMNYIKIIDCFLMYLIDETGVSLVNLFLKVFEMFLK